MTQPPQDTSPEAAARIGSELLHATRYELFGGDVEVFVATFLTPLTVETFFGTQVLRTPGEVRVLHDRVNAYFEARGVTDLVRQVVSAGFRDPDTIQATHESRLMRRNTLAQEPYVAFSVHKRTADGWRIADSSYAITDEEKHARILAGA